MPITQKTVQMVNSLMPTSRKPGESTLLYYERLKQGVESGILDIERSEIYTLLYGTPCSPDHARKCLKVLDLTLEADGGADIVLPQVCSESTESDAPDLPSKTTVEIHKDGSQTRSALIRMREEDSKDPVFLLKAHGYSPEYWELTGARSNIWNAYSKQDGIMELYSSKITVKPLKNGLDSEKIAAHFEDFAKIYAPKAVEPKQYEHGAELFVPALYDVHFDKLGDEDETGEKYNWEIAHERVMGSLEFYISKLRSRKFEKVLFVIGNDYFNCEPSGTTLAGTKQDSSLRYSAMFNKGVETLIEATDMLAQLAPIEIILVQGNHAGVAELHAAHVLNAWYRNCGHVDVDFTPCPRKYRRFGKNLLGFSHGDSEKDRIFGLMQYEAAEAWSATSTREFLLGHLHSEGVTEKNGVVVRRIPSLSGKDYWHTKSGFTTSKKRSMAFIYDKEDGLVETLYANI